MLPLLNWLQNTGWAVDIKESALVFPLIEGSHILSLSFSVGMVMVLDLRLLRISFRSQHLLGKSEYRGLQSRLDKELDATLKRRKDDFLPAAEYAKRAGVSHYQELNVRIGRHPSPWGDWDSTMSPG